MAEAISELMGENAESAAKAHLQRSQSLEGDEIFQDEEMAKIEKLAADVISDFEKEEHDEQGAAKGSASSKSPEAAAANKNAKKEGKGARAAGGKTVKKKTKLTIAEVQAQLEEKQPCALLSKMKELRQKRDELNALKKEQANEVRKQEKKIQRLKKKTSDWSNNDLMNVFLMRQTAEDEKKNKELMKALKASDKVPEARD